MPASLASFLGERIGRGARESGGRRDRDVRRVRLRRRQQRVHAVRVRVRDGRRRAAPVPRRHEELRARLDHGPALLRAAAAARELQPTPIRRMNSSRMMARLKVYTYSSDFGVFANQNVSQAPLSDRQFELYLPN